MGQLTPIGSFDPLIDLVEMDFRSNFSLSKYRLIKEGGAHTFFGDIKNIDSSTISFRLNPNFFSMTNCL